MLKRLSRPHKTPERTIDRFVTLVRQYPKTLLPCLFLGTLATTLWPLYILSQRVVETTAIESATQFSVILEEIRDLYASEVIGRLRQTNVEVTHEYSAIEHAIPLPVTLSILLGERISRRGGGGMIRLYSPYPFPRRETNGGLQDNFAREAWQALSKDPSSVFYRFEKHANKGRVLRYAKADIIRESCVSCHNNHPDSPRKNWRIGDVRGVLEISLPLQNVETVALQDVRWTLILTTLMIAFVFWILTAVIGRLRRISEMLVEANTQLENLSTTDEMTQLANFRFFHEALNNEHKRAMRFATRYALIFIDVDHFKAYNDTNGHQAGDRVLRDLSTILMATIRDIDLAARYGGEEFVVLCSGIDAKGAMTFAERIRKAVYAYPFKHGESQPLGRITVSIGVASYPAHATAPEDVLRLADLALYRSKAGGRNQTTLAES
ncbi:MAG: diguanylate cyclase [Myxococcota bacterium]